LRLARGVPGEVGGWMENVSTRVFPTAMGVAVMVQEGGNRPVAPSWEEVRVVLVPSQAKRVVAKPGVVRVEVMEKV
jgi:hypothetical protein